MSGMDALGHRRKLAAPLRCGRLNHSGRRENDLMPRLSKSSQQSFHLGQRSVLLLEVPFGQSRTHVAVEPGKVLTDFATGFMIERSLQLTENGKNFRNRFGTPGNI